MVEVKVTDEMLLSARDKAAEMGTLNNSILRGSGSIAGFIGEEIAKVVLGGNLNNTYDYDLILDNGKTVDVKTKQTSVVPLETYDCSIAAFNTKQDCDYYCFVRVKNDYTIGWYLGVYNKEEYMKEATFMKKGDIDPSNGYVVRSDCYNIKINQLKEKP